MREERAATGLACPPKGGVGPAVVVTVTFKGGHLQQQLDCRPQRSAVLQECIWNIYINIFVYRYKLHYTYIIHTHTYVLERKNSVPILILLRKITAIQLGVK